MDRPNQVLAHQWPVIAADVLVVFVAYFGALLLRFDGAIPAAYWSRAVVFVSSAVVVYVLVNYFFGAYANDSTVRRATFGGLLTGFLVLAFTLSLGYSRLPLSVAVFGAILSLLGFIVVRLAVRTWKHQEGGDPVKGTIG